MIDIKVKTKKMVHIWSFVDLFFSTCTNGIRNGRVPSGDDEATPAKRSKVAGNADSATASPTPREPFELAQLKTYGDYFPLKIPDYFLNYPLL